MMLQLAMKLAPNRDKFMEVISGTGDIKADIEKFCTTFHPFLKENHDFLVCHYSFEKGTSGLGCLLLMIFSILSTLLAGKCWT